MLGRGRTSVIEGLNMEAVINASVGTRGLKENLPQFAEGAGWCMGWLKRTS